MLSSFQGMPGIEGDKFTDNMTALPAIELPKKQDVQSVLNTKKKKKPQLSQIHLTSAILGQKKINQKLLEFY